MAMTCQHCGATTDNDARVMCPSCGRRMQPAQRRAETTSTPDPEPSAAPPPSPYAPPPSPYGAPPPPPPPAYGAPPPPWPPPPPHGAPPYPPPYGAPPSPPPYAWPQQYAPMLPPPVDVFFRRSAIVKTSRVKVLFRLLLALPHLVVLYLIYIAAEVVAVVAWFAALFTARVPVGMYGFLSWALGYGTRVMTYTGLLTDRWPSFSETPEDAVFVRLPGPLQLNRAAVFFRFVLAFPVAMMAGLLLAGVWVAGFFAWLVVVIAGRVPQPLFDATAAIVRFHTRYYAYLGLLTARYPHGLFGEPQDPQQPPPTEAEAVPAPPVINPPARRVLVTFVVLGSAAFVAYMVFAVVAGIDAARRQQAADDLARAYNAVHLTQTSDCIGSSDPLGCLQQAERQNASTMRGFEETVSTIDFPSDAIGDAAALRQATDAYINDLDALARATTLQDFNAIAAQRETDQAGRAVDDAVMALERKLDRATGAES